MALSLATVGGKITAALYNAIVNWVNPLGQSLVVPPTVAVGSGTFSISTLGKVTFTGASSVSVNGCFTTTYDNYAIFLNIPTSSTANNLTFRFRLSGTDDSSASYDTQSLVAASTTATAAQPLAGTSIGLDGVNAAFHDIEMRLFAPNLAQATRGKAEVLTTANPMTAAAGAYAIRGFLFRNATQFDGFSFIASTATVTGTIRVYGYNNG